MSVAATWRFLRSGAVTLLPVTDADSGAMEALMKRYRDRPMIRFRHT